MYTIVFLIYSFFPIVFLCFKKRTELGYIYGLLNKIKLMEKKALIRFSNLVLFHSDLLQSHQVSINLIRFIAARDVKQRAILIFHPEIDISYHNFISLANARLDKPRWPTWHVGIRAQDNREAAILCIAYQNSKRAPRWITLCRMQTPKHRFASRTTTRLRLAEWVDLCLLESRSQLPYYQARWSLASGRRHALVARGELVHNAHTYK